MTPQAKHSVRFPEKDRARRAVRAALQRGELVRPTACPKCGVIDPRGSDGRSAIHAHHHNGYGRPLDVVWLCAACHAKEDVRAFGENNWRAVITQEIADTIRIRYKPGRTAHVADGSLRQLGREYGISARTVKRIVTGEIWSPANDNVIFAALNEQVAG